MRRQSKDMWLSGIYAPCVYRCWDAAGRLLYIGSTMNLARRCIAHKSASAWWTAVRYLTSTPYPSERQARFVERHAIFAEQPPHNVMNKNAVKA